MLHRHFLAASSAVQATPLIIRSAIPVSCMAPPDPGPRATALPGLLPAVT